MFTPKRKSSPSNLQLVSDEEVAISLERLIDSVVVEVTARRSVLELQQNATGHIQSICLQCLLTEN